MIRVLHVVTNLSVNSGVTSVVMNLYKNIDTTKVQFDFLVHEYKEPNRSKEIEEMGGRIFYIKKPSINNTLGYIKEINDFFKKNQEYKIVHGHMENAASIYLQIAKINKVPIRIVHSHNSKGSEKVLKRFRNKILKLPIKHIANELFACSDLAAINLYGKKIYERGNVKIINNGIDIAKYKFNNTTSEEIKNYLGIQNKYVIGHVGRFNKQKNHKFLIEVFAKLEEMDKETEKENILLLLGEGPLTKMIKDKVKKLKLDDKVLFLGVKSNISEFYQAMDIFVLPSLFEGLPVVGVEAQISGLPCIMSDTITKSINITQKIQFLSLKDGKDKWAKKIILQKSKIENRSCDNYENFDITIISKRLQEYYIQKINELIKGNLNEN